ncbi:N-acetylglucosaminyltransferase [Indibacter alkaliphilus LW1]|uniref:N-acetylglucosaminyltransferase n=1 Tax=Indibacter alkaliphilus (strain CCUG 57479 / KCTC 22604 / LW1) TaxID=1189612 RepID=S2DXN6_INDAL|nr:glycosyltransferase [Indibacter alkaliphilus]EOZ96891.1 N-acetylglucosaminyltransferase [Indibacter alkaliphilus LW1]
MLTIYFLVGILYLLLMGRLRMYWQKKKSHAQSEKSDEMVNILIPFRNEAENLPLIFNSVVELNYRPLQVFFINDASEDNSVKIISKLVAEGESKDISFIILETSGVGKKAALQTGIQEVSSGIILTTDADCKLPPSWVELMCEPFHSDKIQLVAGPVMSNGQSGFLEKFQQVEWASVLLVTQASFESGNPLMCSAANLAFRRAAFMEVGGYMGNEHLLSGDDEFLLKKILRHFGVNSVSYINDQGSLVKTSAQGSWQLLFSQKIRWASKWKQHQSNFHMLSSLLPVLIQLFFLSSFILLTRGAQGQLVFCIVWGVKFLSEYKSLSTVLKSYGIKQALWVFLATSIFHPVYVLRVVLGALSGKFEWKGRKSSD